MADHEGQRSLRIHQAIARQFGIAILSGEIAPGGTFGREIEKAEAMGVSRTAYREAIRILVAKGLLESRPKAGTHVTPRHRWNLLDPDILAWMLVDRPNERFVRDLFELRGIVEPVAAALAATRRTEAHLDNMNRAFLRMKQYGLATVEGQEADRHFHRAILDASDNEALASLSSSVGAAVQWTTHFKQQATSAPRDPMPEHDAVRIAIVAGDAAEASAAMTNLLSLAFDDMAEVLPSLRR